MAAYSVWITKSERIGAALGGLAGFFYGAYILAASPELNWTDVLETIGSSLAVVIFAAIIGSLCVAIGWLAGLVLGIVSLPLRSILEKR